MKHKTAILTCAVLILCAFTGCQLARENDGATTYEDKLIGVFVTTEYLDLFDFEGYFGGNIISVKDGEITMGGNTREYEGRLYATLTTRTLTNEETGETSLTEEYVFEGTPGFAYFAPTVPATAQGDSYTASMSDEAISDGHLGMHYGDDENRITLEGTIYISPSGQNYTYYLNPVYQTSDDRVYLTSGSGLSAPMDAEGAQMSQTMDSSTTITENGKAKTESASIKLSFNAMFTPEKIIVLQMSIDSEILLRAEYAPGAMPEAITPEPGTAYFIVETHKRDDTGGLKVSRAIYDGDADSFESFFARPDGICVKHLTRIE